MLALTLALLLAAPAVPPPVLSPTRAPAPAAADTIPGPPVKVRPRLAPSALYSPSRGVGIAGGVAVSNLGRGGTDLTLDARLSQRYQSLGLSFTTADPFESTVYAGLDAEVETTSRRRYFGVGPFVQSDDQVWLGFEQAAVGAHVGVYPLGTTALIVQPSVAYQYAQVRGVEENSPATPGALDPRSREALVAALGESRYGASVGLELASDLRDWRSYPRSGTFVTVEGRRFFATDGSGLRFNQGSVATVGYLPIRGRTALVGRTNLVVTRADDHDGDGVEDPIPFFYLPTLDVDLLTPYATDRITGRDVFVMAGGVRAPVVDFLGVYGIDLLAMGFLGNAYDNVFDQISPTISFARNPEVRDDGRAPFRPALGIGIGLVNLDKEKVVLGGLVGIGPDGIRLASIRVAYDLRDARSLFR